MCGMCVLFFGVLCCVVMCGVGAGDGAQCVVWGVCVWRGLARGKPPVCRFQTSPCVGSKRFRVYRQDARMLNTQYTRKRLEPAHGDVWNLHTVRREGGFSSLFLFSLPSLVFSLSSLSATMTMITRPVGSLCVHTALTCLSVRVPVLWLIFCLANMFLSCKKQLSWHNCASFVPLEVGVVFVFFVFGCVSMCWYVLSSLCCWLPQCWCRCVGCCVVMTVQRRPKRDL